MAAKKTTKKATLKPINPYVVVRTYSAGVFAGELQDRSGSEATLVRSRRLWKWGPGRLSLHEVATSGAGREARVSVPLDLHVVTGVIEVLHTTAEGERALREAPSYAT